MIAIYARVSTALQVDNTSLDQQIELCTKLAHSMGYTDKEILPYREEGFTGEDIDIRPVMTRLREDVADGLVTHIICTHPDRFSRDLTDKLIAVREFEKNGAEISFTDTEFERSPEGILFFNIISAIASYELALIRKRTVRGRERAVREQKKIMPMRVAPFGYDKDENGQLVINENEAYYVKEIFEWYVYENLRTREIGERLYQAKVLPKRGESTSWSASSIGKILSNEIYIGKYYYNRRQTKKAKGQITKSGNPKRTTEHRDKEDWLMVPVTPIIDDALFELAQQKKKKNTTNKHVGNTKYQYLLKSLLKCGHCGRTWDATTYSGREDKTTGSRVRYRCYRCPNLAPKRYGETVEKCPSQTLRAELIEDYIWSKVALLVSNTKYFWSYLQKESGDGIEDLEKRVKVLEREKKLREKEREKIKIMFRREVISEEEMLEDLVRINSVIQAIEQNLKKYQSQLSESTTNEITYEKVKGVVKSIQGKLENPKELDFAFKRHIIEMLFDEIVVRFEKEGDADKLIVTSAGTFDKLLQSQKDKRLRTQHQEV
jgi:site-specific DNA recombinase